MKKVALIAKAGLENRNKEAWLKLRQQYITGSDAGVIMGVNPYKTLYELYWSKKIDPEAFNPEKNDSAAIHWGKMLEEKVAEEFARITNYKLQKRGMVMDCYCHARAANVDRLIVGEAAGLECKTTAAINADQWSGDNIPRHYFYQCLHYMLVYFCGAEGNLLPRYQGASVRWYIACLIGGQKYVCKKIDFDPVEAKKLAKAEKEFWLMLKNNTPPPVTAKASDEDFIKRLKPVAMETKIDTDTDKTALELKTVQGMIKDLKKEEQRLKNKIIDVLGDAEAGAGVSYLYTYKAGAPRESISMEKLKEEVDLYTMCRMRGIVQTTTPSRILRIKEREHAGD